ncbi:MAG TPA: hypothetical protein VE715_03500 [Blastocatellia bacterium]|nr:hypothetical protein [Blastocatellia bacterium]
MSKKNNVNPDHYKTAGRERPGEDIVHDVYKRQYTQSRTVAGAHAGNFIPGARDEEHIYKLQTAPEAERRLVETHRKRGGK